MRSRVALIGVGNPWRRDDGVGWEVIAAAGRRLGTAVDVVECDGEPSRLLDAWCALDLAVVVDGVVGGASPGAIHVWAEPFGLPVASSAAGSHALGIADAVALGRALDRLPARLIVVGIELDDTSAGHGLSAAVAAAVEEAVDVIADLVTQRGRTRQRDVGVCPYTPGARKTL
jgi:hydrogenase maturation protease